MGAAGGVVNLADEVGQDFGVGLGAEAVPGFEQWGAQGLVVLDDAVVDQRQPPRLVIVRVSVFVGGPPVRGPAGVGNTDVARRRRLGQQVGEGLDAPGTLAGFEPSAVDGDQPGGIVAPVFQPPQTIEQDGGRVCFADVADDSTHKRGS